MEELARIDEYLATNRELRHALDVNEAALLCAKPLGKGEHNENYLVTEKGSNRRFVLRVNVLPQPFHENQVRYEYEALRALEPSGCTPVPLFLDESRETFAYGALVESFCEGQELNFDALRPGDLRCAAQLMANLHAVTVTDGCPLYRPSDPLRELYDECIGRYEFYRTSGFEDARVTAWMERYIKAIQPALEIPFDASCACHVINTETLASHFLIPKEAAEEASLALPGTGVFCEHPGTFVDWERPIIGEVAQDLAYFVSPTTTFWDSEYLFPREDIEGFVADYWRAVDGRFGCPDFERRFWAYLQVSAFRSAMWSCKALARYDAGGSGYVTEKTRAKLPVYLSDEFNEMIFRACF